MGSNDIFSAWILHSVWTPWSTYICFLPTKKSFTFSQSTQEKVKYSAPKIHIKIIALQSDILYLRMMKQTLWVAEPYKSFLISFGVEGKGEPFKEKMIDYICLWVIRLLTRTNSIDSEWLHTVWGQKRHTVSLWSEISSATKRW